MDEKDRSRLMNMHNEPALYDEDYAEELGAETAIDHRDIPDRDQDDDVRANGTGMGYLALALSIISFFFLPIIMGAAGIIIGFIARRQGARGIGAWAIGIGIVSIVLKFLYAAPLY